MSFDKIYCKRYYLLFALSTIFLQATFVHLDAQPAHEHIEFGCHHTKAKIAGIKFSDEELRWARASLERSDTFDIIHYSINLDVSNFSGSRIDGFCDVFFVPKMELLDYINLDIERLTVDSVLWNGNSIDFTHEGPLLTCRFPEILNISDTISVRVYYGGIPMTSASGFGGFYFESGYAYNLGIGLNDKPHNYGRAWYPCFDNFVERSTYEYIITHQNIHTAHCVGTFMGTDTLSNGLLKTTYLMSQEIPTYLSSIAVSNYTHLDYTHIGKYGEVPIRLIARPNQLVNMENSFENLGKAIDAFEHWFGPHIWERVGFVLTSRGAMEHPTNVAYPDFSVAGGNRNERLMAHELAHMWWGNMVTLKTSHDMWIKEANAEYGAHLFTEYVYGHDAFIRQVKDNANQILRRAHIDDGAYLALSPMPEDQTYSTHTYNKGAMIIHNLRAYLGDELFSSAMTSVLENNTYQAIDAREYRDQLSEFASYDLNDFFEDWIFSPGYPTFEVDSFSSVWNGNSYDVLLHIEQKLRARERYCENVPLEIVFFDQNFNHYTSVEYVGGQFSDINISSIPFNPSYIVLNESNALNLGFLGNTLEISSPGTHEFVHAQLNIIVSEVPEPAWIRVEHHFAGADGFKSEQPNIRIGKNRHWKVIGDIPESFKCTATFNYSRLPGTDEDLVGIQEDSLILLYRPDPSVEWIEHPDYEKRILPLPGIGFCRVRTLLAGEYAFANGELSSVTSVSEKPQQKQFKFAPNPVKDNFVIEGPAHFSGDLSAKIIDQNGRFVFNKKWDDYIGATKLNINVNGLPAGPYALVLESLSGGYFQSETLILIE